MSIKYVPIRMPKEFKMWLIARQKAIENVSLRIGGDRRIPLTKVMRIISKTNGIVIDDNIIKGSLKKFRIKKIK